MTQDKDKFWAIVNTLMNFRVAWNVGNCFIRAIIVASEGLLLHTVRYLENLEKESRNCKKQSTAEKGRSNCKCASSTYPRMLANVMQGLNLKDPLSWRQQEQYKLIDRIHVPKDGIWQQWFLQNGKGPSGSRKGGHFLD